MAKAATWIVVADAGQARVFEASPNVNARLGKELQSMTASIPPSREINADRPGRAFDSAGEGRHAMEPPTDPKRHAKQTFALEVVRTLDDARKHNEFQDLVVFAPPTFLGDMRGHMPDALRSCVRKEVAKDYTTLPEPDLQRHVTEQM